MIALNTYYENELFLECQEAFNEMGVDISEHEEAQGLMVGLVLCDDRQESFDLFKLNRLTRDQYYLLGQAQNLVFSGRNGRLVSLKDELSSIQKLYKFKQSSFMIYLYCLSYPSEAVPFFDYYLLVFQNRIMTVIEPEDYLDYCSNGC